MMLALDRAEWRAYAQTLSGLHEKRIRVALLRRNGNVVEDLSHEFLDGQVVVDENQEVSRSTSLQILDPRHRFGFDSDTYQDGDLDFSRMIRVWWIVDGLLLSRPISVAVHTGPVTALRRRGPVVEIETQGKEVYGLHRARKTLVIKKGARRTEAMRRIAEELLGETRFHIPRRLPRLGADLVIRPKDQPWKELEKLARSLGWEVWFDGAGTLRVRRPATEVSWRFGVDASQITSHPEVSADLSEVRNQIRVVGRTPKGKKRPVTGQATAPSWHHLAPQNIGMILHEEVNLGHCRTNGECDRAAESLLNRRLRILADLTFTAAPVPHLEPGDLVRVETPFEAYSKRMDQFTLPLGLGGDMQVGFTDPIRLRKKKRRKRS